MVPKTTFAHSLWQTTLSSSSSSSSSYIMFDVASEAIIAQPINIDIESPRFSKDDDLKMVFLTYQRKFAANLHLFSGDFPASHFS